MTQQVTEVTNRTPNNRGSNVLNGMHFCRSSASRMPLKTNVIGAFPKPAYLDTPDWFRPENDPVDKSMSWNVDRFTNFKMTTDQVEKTQRAIQEVLTLQEELGIDVVSDGEMRRENYVHYFCRHLEGMDFVNTEVCVHREGAAKTKAPTVRGRLQPMDPEPWCADDWKASQKMTSSTMKYTIPGPMTIADSTKNSFYKDHREELIDLRDCIIREVRALAVAGCKHIQIDEPVLVRKPQVAIDYGIDILSTCFEGVGDDVEKIVHLCCGYPTYLDEAHYAKADRSCYAQIAEKLDNSGFDALSFEDAHCYNDLTFLDLYKKSKIIFGSVAVAKSAVETQEAIESRLRAVLQHVPAERLIVAPDCGLGYLPQDVLKQKLKNMAAAASALP